MFNLAFLGVLIGSLNHLFQHYLEAEVLSSYCFVFSRKIKDKAKYELITIQSFLTYIYVLVFIDYI